MTNDRSPRKATQAGKARQAVSDLALAVFRLNGALIRWGDALAGPVGLTSARWQMLGALSLAGKPLTAPQVGDAMGVSRQGAQKQLNALEAVGLVATRANPAHRRSPLYELTETGHDSFEAVDRLWRSEAAALAKVLPGAADAAATLDVMFARLATLHPSSDEDLS